MNIPQIRINSLDERVKERVTVTVTDQKGKVRGLGYNVKNDLILDNFGYFLAAFFRSPIVATRTFTATDITPASRTFNFYHAAVVNTFNLMGWAVGSELQVGNDDTAPARNDTNIIGAFATAPESSRFGSGDGSYAAGYVSLSAAITAGGNGTIKESGLFGVWLDSGNVIRRIMLFRDLIAPTVDFVAGNIINVSYSIAL